MAAIIAARKEKAQPPHMVWHPPALRVKVPVTVTGAYLACQALHDLIRRGQDAISSVAGLQTEVDLVARASPFRKVDGNFNTTTTMCAHIIERL